MDKAVKTIADRIEALLKSKDRVIVAISGFGGSGKTSLAEKLKNHFHGSVWVQLDNFLIDHGQGEGWAGGFDWPRFEQVIRDAHEGKDLHYQVYDWAKDALNDQYINERSPKLVIVEGVRILQPKLLPFYDLTVWIDCPVEIATKQGKARDARDGADQDHLNQWDKVWVPKDLEYFQLFKPDNLADLIVSLDQN